MKITPINLNNKLCSFKKKKKNKKYSPAAKEILKAANSTNIQGDNREKVVSYLKRTIENQKEIGVGGEGNVYEIPNTGYVVKVPHNGSLKRKNLFNDYNLVQKINKREEKCTQVVQKGHNWKIMHKVNGIDLAKSAEAHNKIYGKIAANMPQSAFDDLLRQVAKTHIFGYCFDTIGDNVIIDVENEKFIPIDVGTKMQCSTYAIKKTYSKNRKNQIEPLSCMMDVSTNTDMFNNRRLQETYFKKIYIATAKDCKYTDMFILSERNGFIGNPKIDLIHKKYIELQKEKLEIAKLNLSKKEIENIMKDKIIEFIDYANKLIPSKDLSKEQLLELYNIAKKQQL